MNDQMRQLETETEVMLAELAGKLEATPADAAMLRVKAVVRHELNEHWLGEQSHPEPSPLTVERVRTAVSEELVRERYVVSRPAWTRWASALSAAAMILLGFGVIQYAGSLRPPIETASPELQAQVDAFITEIAATWSEESGSDDYLANIDEIEADVPTWGTDVTADVAEVLNEIDALLASETTPGQVQSGANKMAPGAVG